MVLATERGRAAAIGALASLLTLASLLLLAVPLRGTDAVLAGPSWWVLVPAFTAAELVAVHVQARRESLSVSFTEVPLVVGLVFVAPWGLVAARVIGSVVGLLYLRQTGLKLFFNVSMFAVEATLAATLYHWALDGSDPMSVRGLLVALGTVVVVDLVSAAALSLVIWLKVGEYDEGVLREAVSSGLVAAVANSSVGLLVVVLVVTSPPALGLLLIVVVTLALAYRGYASLSRGHAQLESLYRFTRRVQKQDGTTRVTDTVLQQARDILAAQTAELLVLASVDGPGATFHLSDDEVLEVPYAPAGWLAPALSGSAMLHDGTGGRGAGTAMAAPLEVDGRVVAVLVVSDRPHHLGQFTREDLRLFESLANHAAVALHKSRLVDQLRDEVATQEHLSLHDALTGLPNRRHALRALTAELARPGGTAVLVLDLDGFTQINEALGYAVGDDVLRETGRRLRDRHRGTGRVARLGNDEFVVILSDVCDAVDAEHRARRVLDVVGASFGTGGLNVDVRASGGLAAAFYGGVDALLLLQRADAALYLAKNDRSTLQVWNEADEGHSVRRLALLAGLRSAIDSADLRVHYQPKVDPRSGEATGAEALVRWQDAELGHVGPEEFIPLAEHSGLIHPLTQLVLDSALAQCERWRRSRPTFTVAVNLSTRSLLDVNLVDQVRTALARAGLPARALTLEITETAVMTDLEQSLAVLRSLRTMGVGLSIDDYGTGQSSLAYLKSLPVHEVKVDRSFVVGVTTDRGDAAIVRSTVALSHQLGLRVVAEGVEDQATLELLAAWGCDTVQGYHVSRPLSVDAFDAWLGRAVLVSARPLDPVAASLPAGTAGTAVPVSPRTPMSVRRPSPHAR